MIALIQNKGKIIANYSTRKQIRDLLGVREWERFAVKECEGNLNSAENVLYIFMVMVTPLCIITKIIKRYILN